MEPKTNEDSHFKTKYKHNSCASWNCNSYHRLSNELEKWVTVAQPGRPFTRLRFLAYVVDAVTNYCSNNIIH